MMIGDYLISSAKLEQEWDSKKLYEAVKNMCGDLTNKERYSKFYLKIYGELNPELLAGFEKCDICPYNSDYAKYNDYNELKDDKIQVTVLSSKSCYFDKVSLVAVHFSDKRDDNHNVELWGKYTLWDKIKNRLGFSTGF